MESPLYLFCMGKTTPLQVGLFACNVARGQALRVNGFAPQLIADSFRRLFVPWEDLVLCILTMGQCTIQRGTWKEPP